MDSATAFCRRRVSGLASIVVACATDTREREWLRCGLDLWIIRRAGFDSSRRASRESACCRARWTTNVVGLEVGHRDLRVADVCGTGHCHARGFVTGKSANSLIGPGVDVGSDNSGGDGLGKADHASS